MSGNYVTKDIIAEAIVLLAQMVGGGRHEDVDISGGDHTTTMTDCRYIAATTAGDVKVDYIDLDGTTTNTATIPVNPVIPVRNVTKVYQTGTTASGITIWK